MRLLIVTQAIDLNDPVLGFFHRWIEEFARHTASVEVICLREGTHVLPENVRVHSLGKERGRPAFGALTYALRLLILVVRLRRSYDSVLVHMNAEYVVLGGIFWRLSGKRIALWYAHKSVPLALRIAEHFSHVLLTASRESMRLATLKKRVMGHGIDTEFLQPVPPPAQEEPIELLSVGRLSRAKRVDVLVEAVSLLREQGRNVRLTLVGAPASNEDATYVDGLRERAADAVSFAGPVPHENLRSFFANTHLFLHASDTGSLDKAALEPLAVGVPVITANAELAALRSPALIGAEASPQLFAAAVADAISARVWRDEEVRRAARAYVVGNHSLASLVPRILAEMAPGA